MHHPAGTTRLVTSLAVAALAACGASGEPGPAPAAPDQNDPAYRVERVRRWSLIGNDLTTGHDTLEVQVFAPDGTDTVDAWLDDGSGARLAHDPSGDFRQVIDVSGLEAGEHRLLLAADGADVGFAVIPFQRSHPLYVVVSTDWDDPDNTDHSLQLQEELHARFDELRITHFVGPYTYTDPSVTPARRQQLTDWVLGMRDTHDDEIGLHIHPYCTFVGTTTVPCRTQPSFAFDEGDESGYTVQVSAYTEDEFTVLLEKADEIFLDAGLGKPTSFRAGGWTAELNTLGALARTGYVADTSANNWARLEEWEGELNGVLYEWNREHWASIGDTSQPYYPATDDILTPGDPAMSVLEVPDNGILVNYVTGEEMIEIFEANWDGGALTAPVAYSIGWHPTNFDEAYQSRISIALAHVEQFLASRDAGPVAFATLSELPRVWSQTE